jgi:hypothetical protein
MPKRQNSKMGRERFDAVERCHKDPNLFKPASETAPNSPVKIGGVAEEWHKITPSNLPYALT